VELSDSGGVDNLRSPSNYPRFSYPYLTCLELTRSAQECEPNPNGIVAPTAAGYAEVGKGSLPFGADEFGGIVSQRN
jgi:hypothetical protein